MSTPVETVTVTVTVSEPYTVIAGGWTSMRPVGRRRDYHAEYQGHVIDKTTKDEISGRIRQLAYQAGVRAKIEYVSKGQDNG